MLLGIFYFPFILVGLIGYLLVPFFLEYLKEVIAFGSLTTFLFGIFLLVPKKGKPIFLLCFGFILSLLGFIKLSFYQLYGVKLSASALFVIFETNANEATEFLENYMSVPIFLLAILFALPLVGALFIIKKRKGILQSINPYAQSWTRKVVILVVITGCGTLISWKFKNENILLNSYGSYKEYVQTKEILNSKFAKEENPVVADATSANEEEVFVVVMGESTSRWHMQLYGYDRKTNPALTEKKDELWVFDSIIVPHVHTILSLEKVLTLSRFEDPAPAENASVVQLANAAGFETYWISNQQPVGVFESLSTVIGNASQNKSFVATEGYKYTIHDETLLPVLDQVLAEKSRKKMIFVHLIGTHVGYEKRYPKSFAYFSGKSRPDKSEKANEYINAYDNAVRYNDFIVNTIIEKVEALQTKSYVAYFSDHGDDVYDIAEVAGHNEYLATRPMYEVPFLVWFSEKYKEGSPLFSKKEQIIQRRYNLEDFIYSFAEMSEIRFQKMDSTRSLFNDGFQKRTRWIKDGINYDEPKKN
ncbi:MAG: sulfatase-like hydrolase/transferase [Flavobacteriaceae bacterium]